MTRRRSRFSILHLMALIAVAGIGFTALRISTFAWLKAIYATTLLLLLFSVLAARYRRGLEAAFWYGFAVFGRGYMTIGIAPWQTWGNAAVATFPVVQRPALNPLLWTKDLVEYYASTRTDTLRPPAAPGVMEPDAYQRNREALFRSQERSGALVGIAHLLFTLAIAAGGGGIAMAMFALKERDARIEDGNG